MQTGPSISKVLNNQNVSQIRQRLTIKGMLTVEAAILVPMILLFSVIILVVMLSQFQFALMTAALHQQGITAVNRVSTEVLSSESLPETTGRIIVEESLRMGGEATFGIKSLYLTATLMPAPNLTEFLRERKTHSMHLSIPLPMSLYFIYKDVKASAKEGEGSHGRSGRNDVSQGAGSP